jgi:hypothetical protein
VVEGHRTIAVRPPDWYRRNAAAIAETKRRKGNPWDYSLREIQELKTQWDSGKRNPPYQLVCLNPYCHARHWGKRKIKRYCSKQCAYFMFCHPTRECGACGRTFWLRRRDAKWCSTRCRKNAYNRRQSALQGKGAVYPYTVVVGETKPRYRHPMRGKKRKHRPAGKVITVIKW